ASRTEEDTGETRGSPSVAERVAAGDAIRRVTMGWICRGSRWTTGGWYTSGSAREGAGGGGGGDGSGVGVTGANGAGGGAGVDAERRWYTCTGSAYRRGAEVGAERRRYTCTG